MKTTYYSVALLLSGLAANAATISFNRVSSTAKSHSNSHLPIGVAIHRRQSQQDISVFMDGVYTANITLGDREYKVILDTSSADLWVDRAPETGFTEKGLNMTFEYAYANGALSVDGVVGTAPLKFGTYDIENQAFLDIHDEGEEFLKLVGVNGILGLGLDRIHSAIDQAVKASEGANATWGSSLLRNIFAESNDADNYVSLGLTRSTDGEETQGGLITIGDYEDGYDAVMEQPKVMVYPEDAARWTIIVDGISVDGKDVALKSQFPSVKGAVALVSVDLAAPGGYVPGDLLHTIYKNVKGAVKYKGDTGLRYIVPCNAAPNVTYTIGGKQYPLYSLDLSRFWEERPEPLKSHTVCISSLCSVMDQQTDHDFALGGAFLRNVYTVFDFGDKEGDEEGTPYIQFLSQHDDKATVPHRNMEGRPKEIEPSEAVKILESSPSSAVATATAPASSRIATASASHSSGASASSPTTTGTKDKTGKTAKTADTDDANVLNAADDDSDSSSNEGTFAKWAPAVLGLLGANLLVMLVLLVLGVLNYIKRNGSGGKKSGSNFGSPSSAPRSVPHYILGGKKRESSSSYQALGRPSFVERRDSEVIFDSEATVIPPTAGLAPADRYDPYEGKSLSRSGTPVPPPPPPPPPGLNVWNDPHDPSRSNSTASSGSAYSTQSTVHASGRA